MTIGMIIQIIKEGVSDDIFNNIIDIMDPKEIWKKLWVACLQVSQDVIYSILQELLNYLQVNNPKGFEKFVISIFVNV